MLSTPSESLLLCGAADCEKPSTPLSVLAGIFAQSSPAERTLMSQGDRSVALWLVKAVWGDTYTPTQREWFADGLMRLAQSQ